MTGNFLAPGQMELEFIRDKITITVNADTKTILNATVLAVQDAAGRYYPPVFVSWLVERHDDIYGTGTVEIAPDAWLRIGCSRAWWNRLCYASHNITRYRTVRNGLRRAEGFADIIALRNGDEFRQRYKPASIKGAVKCAALK